MSTPPSVTRSDVVAASTTATDYDVVVVGAGVGGHVVAQLLARQRRRVLLVDKQTRDVHTFKGELLQPGSLAILDDLGLLGRLEGAGARRVDRLTSCDQSGAELCSMDYRWLGGAYDHCLTHTYLGILTTFSARSEEVVEVRRGAVVDGLLRDAAGRVCGVELRTGRRTEQVIAPLVVACDGVSSRLRSAVGVAVEPTTYDHQVLAFDLAGLPHLASEATTVVTPEGMRVTYPMPDGGARLYLQVPDGLARQLGKRGLQAWAEGAVGSCAALTPLLGAVREAAGSSRVLSARRYVAPVFHADGVPLVGDAAHAVHPMAGQGMNAAIADAAALAAALHQVDLADRDCTARALAGYDADRRPEVLTLAEFSHRFAALFTQTRSRSGYSRSRYVLSCHGRNPRLCYKIMHNISGMGFQRFSVLDRLQQVGLPDRRARRLPAPAPLGAAA